MRIVFALLLFVCQAFAQPRESIDVVLRDGTVLKSATIKTRDPASVTFSYEDGLKRVLIASISAESFKALGISYNPEEAMAFEQKQQAEAAVDLAEKRLAVANLAGALALEEAKKRGEYLRVIVKQIVDGGALCEEYTRGDIFIVGDFSAKVDGDRWEGWVWRDGRFQFKTVLGAERTIEKWNTEPTVVESEK